ncbi:hypothetical protein ACJ73_05377 [Blastomyces percursus]|uniref:40S ribosomal protein S25 n=1 Tax=Blastomyces percursus TaxID=1658174 RepID=A0A1J9R432_9EURO|nr:hypothetical protein ACJ73_05377 [Blastomyces percursus]
MIGFGGEGVLLETGIFGCFASTYCGSSFPPDSSARKEGREDKWKLTIRFSNNTVKDKSNHAVVLDKATSEKLYKDVQSYRLITVATLVDRLKINGSLAREALADLEEKGQIKKVVGHSKMNIYTRAVTAAE